MIGAYLASSRLLGLCIILFFIVGIEEGIILTNMLLLLEYLPALLDSADFSIKCGCNLIPVDVLVDQALLLKLIDEVEEQLVVVSFGGCGRHFEDW